LSCRTLACKILSDNGALCPALVGLGVIPSLFGYFVVLGLLFVVFFKISGRLLDQRTAGISGLAALVLAAFFPLSASSIGPVKTVLLYLGAAPLIGLGTSYLTRSRAAVQPLRTPLALPPAPAVASLPAAAMQADLPEPSPLVEEPPEIQPAVAEKPDETRAVLESPAVAPAVPAGGPVAVMAAVDEVVRDDESVAEELAETVAQDTETADVPADIPVEIEAAIDESIVAPAEEDYPADMSEEGEAPAAVEEPEPEIVEDLEVQAEEHPAESLAKGL